MGKKLRREAQKAEEVRQALATTKAAEARAAKRALAAAKAEEAEGTLETAKAAVVEAADPVADVATQAAEEVKEQVVEPVVATVRKPKKARFVREQTAKKPRTEDAPLPPRSTTAAGKMMSTNVTLPPKEMRSSGPKNERTTGPKPKA
jgi:hypothetical protein